MVEISKKRAHELYKLWFSKGNLKEKYEEKISISLAIGKDGVRQEKFRDDLDNQIDIILNKTNNFTYKFTPYKQKLISKGALIPPRVISIPTIRDRLTLRIVNDIISQVFYEAKIFRPHVYIKKIGDILNSNCGNLSFVRIDIENFYPSINHDILFRKIRRKIRKLHLMYIIGSAISNPMTATTPATIGVPQGLSISNILSSIYLNKLDETFSDKYKYFRYVDDILVICESEKANSAFNKIRKQIEKLKLKVHPLNEKGKSRIVAVSDGIDYLGFHLRPNSISVRDSSFKRMMENILSIFTKFKYRPEWRKNEDQFIWNINMKITGCIFEGNRFGWMFFFSQINDLRQLGRLDDFVWQQLQYRKMQNLRPRVKKFLRSYHEIRKNLKSTTYIPKFDNLTLDEMIGQLSEAEGHAVGHYKSKYSEAQIRERFIRVIKRQTRTLERDLIEVFS